MNLTGIERNLCDRPMNVSVQVVSEDSTNNTIYVGMAKG
jgi:hypothetical protein